MTEMKFQIGYPVTVELVEAREPAFCRFGYKVGDSWDVSVYESSGLCGLAYNYFFPYIMMFQTGGKAVWKPTEEEGNVIRSCPDVRPGFRFMIKRTK